VGKGFSKKRRSFLKLAGASPALGLANAQSAEPLRVAIFVRPAQPLLNSAPVLWARGELEKALRTKGATLRQISDAGAAGGELVERETLSASTLVFIMQKLVDNSELTTLVQILIKQKPAKLKALLKSLTAEGGAGR